MQPHNLYIVGKSGHLRKPDIFSENALIKGSHNRLPLFVSSPLHYCMNYNLILAYVVGSMLVAAVQGLWETRCLSTEYCLAQCEELRAADQFFSRKHITILLWFCFGLLVLVAPFYLPILLARSFLPQKKETPTT